MFGLVNEQVGIPLPEKLDRKIRLSRHQPRARQTYPLQPLHQQVVGAEWHHLLVPSKQALNRHKAGIMQSRARQGCPPFAAPSVDEVGLDTSAHSPYQQRIGPE